MGVSREEGGNFVSMFRALLGDFKRLKEGRRLVEVCRKGSRKGSQSISSASFAARSKTMMSAHFFWRTVSQIHSFCLAVARNEVWAVGISPLEGAYFAKFCALRALG